MSGRVPRGCLVGLCGLLAGCTVPTESGPATVGSIAPIRAPLPALASPRLPVAKAVARGTGVVRPVVAHPARPVVCDLGHNPGSGGILVGPAPCSVSLRPTLQP